MPSDIATGTAVVYGIANGGQAIEVEGIIGILDTAKVAHRAKVENVEDELGFTVSKIAVDGHLEADFVFTPKGADRAAAAAQLTELILETLTKVTIKNFQVPLFNGDWLYEGEESVDLSHKTAKVMLKLRKWDDPDQNKALTTVAS